MLRGKHNKLETKLLKKTEICRQIFIFFTFVFFLIVRFEKRFNSFKWTRVSASLNWVYFCCVRKKGLSVPLYCIGWFGFILFKKGIVKIVKIESRILLHLIRKRLVKNECFFYIQSDLTLIELCWLWHIVSTDIKTNNSVSR